MTMRLQKIGLGLTTVAAAAGLAFGGAATANAATVSSASALGTSADGATGLSTSVDTSLSASEIAQVTAAVQATDSLVVVTSVRKNPDGSYYVVGTKAGATVTYKVSADLKTVVQLSGPGA
jgi:hypothetical protein